MAASLFYNRVKYTAAAAGLVDFATGASITGFRTPAGASIPDGTLVSYVALSSDLSEWETGQGAYTVATTTVARTTIRESSNAGAKVNFTAAPTVALDLQAQDAGLLAPLASPTFTGTVTVPTPFTVGAVSVTTTGTRLNYLTSAAGTTGTTSTNIVFSTSPTLVTPTLGAATVTSIAVNGDTTFSRNAAGIWQFGTNSANAAGSWVATNGTLTGTLAVAGTLTATAGLQIGAGGSLNVDIINCGPVTSSSYLEAASTRYFGFTGRATIFSPSSGNILLGNYAEPATDFGRLMFGGTTPSFPAIKRSGTGLEIKLADDSAYSTLKVLGGAYFIATGTALTDGAAAQVATLTNGPTAGNPTKWVAINDNGTTRYIPAW